MFLDETSIKYFCIIALVVIGTVGYGLGKFLEWLF